MKIEKIKYYLEKAEQAAKRSTCPRAHVGAILVKDDRDVSTGFNGSPRGTDHCEDKGCWLYTKDGRTSCRLSVHAELNALLNAAYLGISVKDAMLFVTHRPCIDCTKALINAGIKEVFYLQEYPDKLVEKLLSYNKIQFIKMNYGRSTRK